MTQEKLQEFWNYLFTQIGNDTQIQGGVTIIGTELTMCEDLPFELDRTEEQEILVHMIHDKKGYNFKLVYLSEEVSPDCVAEINFVDQSDYYDGYERISSPNFSPAEHAKRMVECHVVKHINPTDDFTGGIFTVLDFSKVKKEFSDKLNLLRKSLRDVVTFWTDNETEVDFFTAKANPHLLHSFDDTAFNLEEFIAKTLKNMQDL